MHPLIEQTNRTSALQFMNQVRKKTNPPGSTFISALDEHIIESLPSSRLPCGEGSTLNRGDVIEIQGPAASGKTHLLYFLCITTILPFELSISATRLGANGTSEPDGEEWPREVLFGGRGKSVVVFDCDGRWSMSRLRQVLSAYVCGKVGVAFSDVVEEEDPDAPDGTTSLSYTPSISEILTDCLGRVLLFQPTSSMSLACTLLSLPTYHKTKMSDQEICMVMIDSMSAFHHSDKARLETEQAAAGPAHYRPPFQPPGSISASTSSSSSSTPPPPLVRADPNHMKHVLTSLNALRQHLGFVTFLTNWAISGSDGKSISSTHVLSEDEWFGQHLIAPYPRLPLPNTSRGQNQTSGATAPITITHHITLPADPLPSYQADSTLTGAMIDPDRKGMVDPHKGREILGLVRTPVVDLEHNVEGRPVTNNTLAKGIFQFVVRNDSIGVE